LLLRPLLPKSKYFEALVSHQGGRVGVCWESCHGVGKANKYISELRERLRKRQHRSRCELEKCKQNATVACHAAVRVQQNACESEGPTKQRGCWAESRLQFHAQAVNRMPQITFKIQEDAPRKDAWLRKRGKRLKMWTRRWCVIDWDELSHKALLCCYDKDDITVEPHSKISMDRCLIQPERSHDEYDSSKGGAYAFSINTVEKGGGGKVYIFFADSDDERMQWIKDLRYLMLYVCIHV